MAKKTAGDKAIDIFQGVIGFGAPFYDDAPPPDMMKGISGEDEIERTERLRKTGIGQAKGAAQRAEMSAQELRQLQEQFGLRGEEVAKAFEESGKVGRAGMRMQAAQALRAGGAQRGGGSVAAMRQTGMQTGQSLAEQEEEFARKIAAQRLQTAGDMYKLAGKTGQAEVESKLQGLEATKFEKEAGSQAEDRAQKIRDYGNQISEIKKNHKGGLGGVLPDDEEGAADAILALMASEPDKEMKAWLKSQSDRARKDI